LVFGVGTTTFSLPLPSPRCKRALSLSLSLTFSLSSPDEPMSEEDEETGVDETCLPDAGALEANVRVIRDWLAQHHAGGDMVVEVVDLLSECALLSPPASHRSYVNLTISAHLMVDRECSGVRKRKEP
jgi:hypothetical protein